MPLLEIEDDWLVCATENFCYPTRKHLFKNKACHKYVKYLVPEELGNIRPVSACAAQQCDRFASNSESAGKTSVHWGIRSQLRAGFLLNRAGL